jgi:hypothetical protein
MPLPNYESISVTNTAVGFTASLVAASAGVRPRCGRAFITAETAQMRFRYDGTDPTSAEGHLLNVGDILTFDDHQSITSFKAIRTGAVSGVIKVTYEYPGN